MFLFLRGTTICYVYYICTTSLCVYFLYNMYIIYIHHPTNPLTSSFFLKKLIFTCLWNVPRSYNAKCDRPRGWRQCPLQSVAFPKNKALRSSPEQRHDWRRVNFEVGFLAFFAGILQINTRIYIVCICNTIYMIHVHIFLVCIWSL